MIPRASLEELLASQFVPQRPEQLRIYQVKEGLDSKLEVSWKASSCTKLYVVSCKRVSGGGEGFSQQVKGNRTRLEGLESCTDYEVSVIPVLGHMYGKYASALVSTILGLMQRTNLTQSSTPLRTPSQPPGKPTRNLTA